MKDVIPVAAMAMVVGFAVFSVIRLILSKYAKSPTEFGGDQMEVTVADNGTVKLMREFGLHGTKLVAVVEHAGQKAVFAKGYLEGTTGFSFSLLGQKLGVGVSYIDGWVEENRELEGAEFTAFIQINRLHCFFINELVTFRVGTLRIKEASLILESRSRQTD